MFTKALTYWQPNLDLSDESPENHNRLWDQFRNEVLRLGHTAIRHSIDSPSELIQWANTAGRSFDWHQDCGGVEKRFLLWSNVQPSDILLPDGMLMEVIDGAIIRIDNREVHHRTPSPVHPRRWLIHAYMK
jgi:hypothetical protein